MTALRSPEPSASAVPGIAVPGVWVLAADARTMDADGRDRLAGELRERAADSRALLLETCHRVELYTATALPAIVATEVPSGARVVAGPEAVRHLLRVAAGLESAVIGEDQVLAQLRRASDALRAGGGDPVLHRLVQAALGVGRRVRRGGRPRERGLATRALSWLSPQIGGLAGRRLLIAGAGDMGTAIALAAAHRGADVVVATRTPRRLPSGLPAIDLEAAARLAPAVDGIVVALSGPWTALGADDLSLPPLVDLSAPAAVPAIVRARTRSIDADGLFLQPAAAGPADDAFVRRAEAEVEAAAVAFERWVAARPSAPVAGRLHDRARRLAAARAEQALRRMPGLPEREREIVRRLAAQVAADLLHEPLSHLGTDADGRAREGAQELFDL